MLDGFFLLRIVLADEAAEKTKAKALPQKQENDYADMGIFQR